MVSSSQVPDGLVISGGNTSAERTGRKLRSACELCRSARVKCDGGSLCQRCGRKGKLCQYKASLRSGRMRTRRPRGTSSDTMSATVTNLSRGADGGPSNIVQSTNFGVESFAVTGLNFPNVLTSDLDYLELHGLASRRPLRTLSPAALTYELLGTTLDLYRKQNLPGARSRDVQESFRKIQIGESHGTVLVVMIFN
ncbi:Zn(II)2Cys6 transcription factor domain-containing protein [Aspergillus thermomutatus]|uniref:Zn(2)-C6 fungal-type domain-containing protein n=1 Tax=Aspergillus thermomutatus TaxID=41047 RepID=A0A397GK36_ASPTH|nr:uncharacterized protein CDV56_105489 [Aspergillus thermomutatus]RHZ48410.1 hypothetical protein CDV56_105489 [Aspergillus thermomutatus]